MNSHQPTSWHKARPLSLLALLTAAAAWLYAHEGHEALPTKGATPLKDAAGRVVGVALAPEAPRRKLLGLGLPAEQLDRLLRGEGGPVRTLAVSSPLAGVVDHIDAAVGQVVGPGDHLLEVVDPSRVWVRIDVLEKDLHRVRP